MAYRQPYPLHQWLRGKGLRHPQDRRAWFGIFRRRELASRTVSAGSEYLRNRSDTLFSSCFQKETDTADLNPCKYLQQVTAQLQPFQSASSQRPKPTAITTVQWSVCRSPSQPLGCVSGLPEHRPGPLSPSANLFPTPGTFTGTLKAS